MRSPRVVVTGIGAVTPVGIGVDASWQAILRSASGGRLITSFDTTNYTARVACEVRDFDPLHFMERKTANHVDRFAQFGLAAAKMAVADAGLEITEANAPEVGVLIGSGIGGLLVWERQHTRFIEGGPHRVSPYLIPMMISDMAAGIVSIETGARGPNMCIATACASGAHSIGEAAAIIRRGDAQVMITGGCEGAITPMGMAGFGSMKAISTRNDDPQHASRPFDAERDGFVMGEGAGILVLEAYDHALARGAQIYGDILGYGATSDAYHITAPHEKGLGAIESMKMALRSAGLTTDQVSYINAHGTSTLYNDKIETLAIKEVFGEGAYRLPVSSTKSSTGHMLGAGGSVELIFCLLAIRDGVVPATINYETPDPECDLDCVPNTPREMPVKVAMSNSFGFGGHNACLIVGRV